MMNKKGQAKDILIIIVFFLAISTILAVGFIASLSVAVVEYASDEITPIMVDLGVVQGVNYSDLGRVTFGSLDVAINSLKWMVGFVYLLMLILVGSMFAMSDVRPNPAMMGLYILFTILLIMASILISNAYEDVFRGNDVIAERIVEQTLLSFLLLYSPLIVSIISLVSGIFLFARGSDGGV